jgi:gliding motility-associatede transport system auxiliary component
VEGLTVKRTVGLLGWLGVALVVVALVMRFLTPNLQEWYRGLAIAGLVVTALYAMTQWRDIGRSFQGRNVQYGSMALGSVLIFLAILAGINWISSRQHKRWDLTELGQYSLSEQTKQLLRSLQKPLTMKVFYKSGEGQLERFRDQLGEYTYTSSNVSVEYIDPEEDPMKAKALDVQAYGTIVMEYEGKVERTTSTDEAGLANALKRLLEGKAKKIYFLQGHGERDTDSSDPEGYSIFAGGLKSENFDVGKLALAQNPVVPDDATVVIAAGPSRDYMPEEITALKAYLDKGGKLWLMLDPPDSPKTLDVSFTNLIAFAKDWNIDVGNNIVLDQQALRSATTPVVADYQKHPITERFAFYTAYAMARTVTPIDGGTNGRFAQKLFQTSPRSWAESDLKELFATRKPTQDAAKGDKTGPVSLAAAVNVPAASAPTPADGKEAGPKPETRVVVVGDSDFVSNQLIGWEGDRDFGLNIANWLAQQENLIAIRPKDPKDSRLTLTQDSARFVFWSTILVVPGLLFLTAFRVWWKRR